jgi:acetyltransferase (GNAT) family protein
MERLRSEYRLRHLAEVEWSGLVMVLGSSAVRHVDRTDHEALAYLMLDAYLGSVDDEGEDIDDARGAISQYFERIVWPHSYVITNGAQPLAMSMVVVVDGVHYIDPVATAAAHKRNGHGRAAVAMSLQSLAAAGVDEVGAVITDGNTSSEHLFGRFDFVRVGEWT